MPSNGKKNSKEKELTVKEVSSCLDISESTVKKYLKDFDLSVEKGSGSKAIISEETFQALSEIAKLRANGLSIQEIKELKSQEPSKNILDEIEETESSKRIEVENIQREDLEPIVSSNLDEEAKEISGVELDGEKDKTEAEELSDEKYIQEEQEEGQRRRRGFNYRYVERQISNDSKRIASFRQRLKNPNLPVQDRLFFEEALERRILFLDGWKHILRWISK